MKTFLQQVADAYLSNESDSLHNYCFIFPNKRSGVFFENAMQSRANGTIILPTITTISELIDDLSGCVEASRYEQLFILYDIYRSLSDDVVDFDRFLFWGDMILNDFNDVDKYLVDARQLFVNVQRYKEIKSNYLTDEQKEVIKKYWGEDRMNESADRFWQHVDESSSDGVSRGKFMKLWEVMYELYNRFNDRLEKSGLSYSGRSYRKAVEVIKHTPCESLPYKRYVFVGFSMLSAAEIKIFERLRNIDCADFYWDYNSPAFCNEHNKASRFIPKYIKEFPSKYNAEGSLKDTFPQIRVLGIPSNVGQVKETRRILNELIESNALDANNAINTAVVLPDENLFIPLVHSFPEEIKTVNITMGFPMRHTPVASLMKAIVSMQLRARIVKGECVYFYEDVQDVTDHPLSRAIAPLDCELIKLHITSNRVFNLPASYLLENYTNLECFFAPVKDIQNVDDVFGYIIKLVDFIIENLSGQRNSSLDVSFMSHYRQALFMLQDLMRRYEVEMKEHTIFHLIERAISSDTVNFEGEPLKGLQIMGVLETRAIDFENVILLSMNERVFPRKHYSRSFIPEALRKGYGMSTIEFQESIYAYYFYRLIARARNAYLLYDARTSGTKSGDMSRYLYQLKFLYPATSTKFGLVDYDVFAANKRDIGVDKDESVMLKLNQYRTPGSGKYLSSSVIKKYVHCPLQFYLEKIEGLTVDDEIKEYMDDITYGNVLHAAAENIYTQMGKSQITAAVLDDWLENRDKEIDEHLTMMINKHYLRSKVENDTTPITGEAAVLKEIMEYMLKQLFQREKAIAPIDFIAAEKRMIVSYRVSDELQVNFKQIIDRVDYATVNGERRLRIVDYKTGGDEIDSNFEKIFNSADKKNDGAILQLFIYCLLYSQCEQTDEPIQPIIYKMRALNKYGLSPLKVNGVNVFDYRDLKDEFVEYFNRVLEEIFDPNVPFRQTENDNNCKYCHFKNICGKEPHTK